MKDLNEQFIKLIHSRWGSFVQWATGAIIGYIISLAAKQGFEMPQEVRDVLTEILALLFAFIATFVTQWYSAKQTQKIQRALGVPDDAWPGPKTVEAAREAN